MSESRRIQADYVQTPGVTTQGISTLAGVLSRKVGYLSVLHLSYNERNKQLFWFDTLQIRLAAWHHQPGATHEAGGVM